MSVSWGVLQKHGHVCRAASTSRCTWCVVPRGQDGPSSMCAVSRGIAGESVGFRASHMEWGVVVRPPSQVSCPVGMRTYWEETQGVSGYFLQGWDSVAGRSYNVLLYLLRLPYPFKTSHKK